MNDALKTNKIDGMITFEPYVTIAEKNGATVLAGSQDILPDHPCCVVVASDKFLEIVTPTDIAALLREIPDCHAIVTTGQKATDIIVEEYGCEEPEIGSFSNVIIAGKTLRFWRMPSSSRAYPLPLEKKAEYYRKLFTAELQ